MADNEALEACRNILKDAGINPASTIEFEINGMVQTFSLQEIAEHYLQASEPAQLVFIAALQKAAQAEQMGIQKFFEGMGKLLLMASCSETFDGALG